MWSLWLFPRLCDHQLEESRAEERNTSLRLVKRRLGLAVPWAPTHVNRWRGPPKYHLILLSLYSLITSLMFPVDSTPSYFLFSLPGTFSHQIPYLQSRLHDHRSPSPLLITALGWRCILLQIKSKPAGSRMGSCVVATGHRWQFSSWDVENQSWDKL